MSKTSRADRIRGALDVALATERIRGYHSATGRPGRRWIIEMHEGGGMFGSVVLTTKEAEAFVLGISAR